MRDDCLKLGDFGIARVLAKLDLFSTGHIEINFISIKILANLLTIYVYSIIF